MSRKPPPEPAPDDAADAAIADTAFGRPSKTRLKAAAHDLQALGESVMTLPEERIRALPLSETLLDALLEGKRIRSHEGRRRHLQYVGKLMRGADPEPLREAVADAQLGRARDALALHRAERWRAELVAGDEAITRFGEQHRGADLQRLRALVRNARKDAAAAPEQRSGRAYRELFQFIREQDVDDEEERDGGA